MASRWKKRAPSTFPRNPERLNAAENHQAEILLATYQIERQDEQNIRRFLIRQSRVLL